MKPFEQLDLLYSTIFSVIKPVDLVGTLLILGLLFLLPNGSSDLSAHSPAFVEKLFGLQAGDVRHLLFDLGSLLTVRRDHQDVHFLHTSLSDYLFDRSRSRQFWIDAGAIYAEIAAKYLPHSFKLWDSYGKYSVNIILDALVLILPRAIRSWDSGCYRVCIPESVANN